MWWWRWGGDSYGSNVLFLNLVAQCGYFVISKLCKNELDSKVVKKKKFTRRKNVVLPDCLRG